jgi:hypothetical protein
MQVKIKRLNEKYGYCFCTGTARMPVYNVVKISKFLHKFNIILNKRRQEKQKEKYQEKTAS